MFLNFWIRLLGLMAARVLEGTTTQEQNAAEQADVAKQRLVTARAQKSRACRVSKALAV